MKTLSPSGVLMCLLAGAVVAAPPKLNVPAEIKAEDGYARWTPPEDVVSAEYVTESGLRPLPSDLLRDPRRLVVPTDGKPVGRHKFWVVASNDKGEQTKASFHVVIGTATELPPPKDDPVDKLPPPKEAYYFLVVRPDGPAAPAFTKIMELPAWGELKAKGHQYKDKTESAAKKDLNLTLPAGTPLPCVVTLKVSGKNSKVVNYSPMPQTDAEILKLPEGLK